MIIHNSLATVEGKIIEYFKKYKLEIQLDTQYISFYKISFFLSEELDLNKDQLKSMILDCFKDRSDCTLSERSDEELVLEVKSLDVLVLDDPEPPKPIKKVQFNGSF